jgi:hypothetical protein
MQFEWRGAKKLVSSSLVGTSPEFELALYTLCFYSGQQEAVVTLGPYRVLVTCYVWPPHAREGQPVFIATSFPSEAPLDEQEVRVWQSNIHFIHGMNNFTCNVNFTYSPCVVFNKAATKIQSRVRAVQYDKKK